MNDTQALAEIQRLARLGRVRFTRHAFERMDERGATLRDVVAALVSATAAVHQPDRGTWRVEGGRDRVGDDLTVVVALEADVVVITVF